ncbi:carboxypeptidase-like regulatory domain-containing protein [Psychroserpens ponticola]|uniref:Carboxypeptidase-like regulatory domain-containing protein n=1 Tax=Psychroserpens ponticola TaxID=2932268 RepID=A0ABY7RVU2_9FLAO|nr:carboxypeptidase-like regulatory domain-containing protein [Psychroserpens ponticola]WCO01054.1 carboxypeptidase-like regulatory domain-containing protein [Psychroserpens ponticola]
MTRIKKLFLILCLVQIGFIFSQSIEIQGKVIANSDIDRIHIINKTANRFTITNDDGKFKISASVNDTILISAIQYKPLEVVVTPQIIQTKFIAIDLTDKITELDEVVVGKILTGDLLSDIENSDVKRDINFYDLGIPGYTGKQKTQSERRLHQATTGSGLVPLTPILNWLSGRTKELKGQVARENLDNAMNDVVSELSEMLFNIDTLQEAKRVEFFYFVTDDPKFLILNKTGNNLKMLEFLQLKLKEFKSQIEDD